MVSPIYLFVFGSLCLLFSLEKSYANSFEGKETTQTHQFHHTLQVSSLFPDSICSHSSKGPKSSATTLKVVNKHGPCAEAQLNKGKKINTQLDHEQLLKQDQDRVNSIHARISNKLRATDSIKEKNDVTLPAKSGSIIGSGNYIVTVGLGDPKQDLSLIFDTGSDLTWTQCQPCSGYCYDQKEPIFDPTMSTTYANITCTSAECSQLKSATGIEPICSKGTSTCIYEIQYGDGSISDGYFAKEKITLSSLDYFDNFLFGCGQNNQGLFNGSAGLLGLGRNKISIIEQTAQKYNRLFSYCLPSTSSSTGHLTFGGQASNSVKYTPLSTISGQESFYALEVVGISVAGSNLSISETVFSSPGTIIDSGTAITRLPPTVYKALKSAFRQQMTSYPLTSAFSIFDTCYNLANYQTCKIPNVSFYFGGGVVVDLQPNGILVPVSASKVCLAFAPNNKDSDVAIFGNVQQKKLEVVYDVGGKRLGFGVGGCS